MGKEIRVKNSNYSISKKVSILTITLIILSLYAYRYGIVFYYTIFLVPIYFIGISKSRNIKKELENPKLVITIIIWFLFNILILINKAPIIDIEKLGIMVVITNVLILSWINCIIFACFFYEFYKVYKLINQNIEKKHVINWLVSLTVILGLLMFFSLKVDANNNYRLIPILIIFSIIYTFLLRSIFSRSHAVYINFLLALSPIITVISAWVIMFLILRTIYFSEVQRPVMLVGITFMQYFQILSLSSIFLYFNPNKPKFKLSHNFRIFGGILLAIFLSIGMIIQKLYFNYLYY